MSALQAGLTLYPDDRHSLSLLSDDDRGKLLLALIDTLEGVESAASLTPQAQMAYAFLSARIAGEKSRRDRRSEVNRTNAAKRWAVREGTSAAEEDG